MPEPARSTEAARPSSSSRARGPLADTDALRLVSDRVLRLLIIGVGIAVLVYAATVMRVVVLGVLLAIVLTTALEPIVGRLQARGVPRGVASILGVLTGIGVLVAVIAVIVPPAVAEFGDLGSGVAGGVDVVQDWANEGFLGLSGQELSAFVDQAQDELESNAGQLSRGALSGAVVALEVLAGLALAIVLLFFFLKDGDSLWRWLVELAPSRHRADVDELGRRLRDTLGSYLRGATLVALADGILTGVALIIIGVPLVLPLALLTFLGAFVPIAGVFVAGLASVLVALVAVGPIAALATFAAVVLVQQIEGNLLQPLVMGRTLSLHPVAVLTAVTAGGILAGIVGTLIATPVVAMGAAALKYWRFERAEGGGALPAESEPSTGADPGPSDDAHSGDASPGTEAGRRP